MISPTGIGEYSIYDSDHSLFVPIQKNVSHEQIIGLVKEFYVVFAETYNKRESLLQKMIADYYSVQDFEFKTVDIELPYVWTKPQRFRYAIHYESKTIFLDSIFNENYTSVINSIEEVASVLYTTQICDNMKPEEIRWVNFFNNTYEGIFHEIKLRSVSRKEGWFIFGRNIFRGFDGPEFITDHLVSKERMRTVWADTLSLDSRWRQAGANPFYG